jgi:hypothetical protein
VGTDFNGTTHGDNVLVIDLSKMNGVTVDVGKKEVHALAGARLSDIDGATAPFGLAVPTGTVPHTGVSGLCLGGGVGRLSRLHGFTCDNIIRVLLVDANGDIRVVDDESDSELMWGIRGAGSNFGIAIQFTFKAYNVPPVVVGGALLFPPPFAPKVVETVLAETSRNIHDRRLTIGLAVVHPPPAPCPMVAATIDFIGPPDDEVVVKTLSILRGIEGLAMDLVHPMSYLQMQKSLEPLVDLHSGWYGTDLILKASHTTAERILEAVNHRITYETEGGSPHSLYILMSMAFDIPPNPRSSFNIPRSPESILSGGCWWQVGMLAFQSTTEEKVQSERREKAKVFCRKIKHAWPLESQLGVYAPLNNPDEDSAAYFSEDKERLRALKSKLDPNNMFCFNAQFV